MIEILIEQNEHGQVIFEARRLNADGVAAAAQFVTDPTQRYLNKMQSCAERAMTLQTIKQVQRFAAMMLRGDAKDGDIITWFTRAHPMA